MVWLKLARSSVAPPATVNALPADKHSPRRLQRAGIDRGRARIVLLPDRVNVPPPILVSPPLPRIVPANVVLVCRCRWSASPTQRHVACAGERADGLVEARQIERGAARDRERAHDAKAFAAPACSVPALTAVAPK